MILHGAGVGGGSLVYANTLMQPDDSIFRGPTWNVMSVHDIDSKTAALFDTKAKLAIFCVQ